MGDAVRRHGLLALRLLVSAALLALVLVYVEVDEIARAVRKGDWAWFAVAVVLMAAATVVGALRWWLLLRSAEIELSRRRAARTFGASLLLNHVLPTSVGGDAARTWLVGRASGRFSRATAATVVDKVTAVGCAFVVAWAALLFDRHLVPSSVVAVLFWVSIGLVAGLTVVIAVAAGIRPVIRRLPDRLRGIVREVWATLAVWITSTSLIVGLVSLGVVYQVLALLALVLVGWTLGVDLPFALAAVVGPIVVVATLVPISVGGLGVREGAFVLLLAEAGIDGAEATVISLLSAAVVMLASAGVVVATAASEIAPPKRLEGSA